MRDKAAHLSVGTLGALVRLRITHQVQASNHRQHKGIHPGDQTGTLLMTCACLLWATHCCSCCATLTHPRPCPREGAQPCSRLRDATQPPDRQPRRRAPAETPRRAGREAPRAVRPSQSVGASERRSVGATAREDCTCRARVTCKSFLGLVPTLVGSEQVVCSLRRSGAPTLRCRMPSIPTSAPSIHDDEVRARQLRPPARRHPPRGSSPCAPLSPLGHTRLHAILQP